MAPEEKPENTGDTDPTKVFSDLEIFTKIWTSPREVLQYLNDYKYDKFVILLLALAGITRAFDRAATQGMGDDSSLFTIIGFSVVLGGLMGWLTFFIYGGLLSWTGGWLNGKGKTNDMVRMLAHAMIPSIVALVFLVPQVALFGKQVFQSEINFHESDLLSISIFYGALVLELAMGFWSLVIMIVGIAVVQKFSIGKAILNFLLPGLLLLGLGLVLGVLVFSLG